MAQAHGRYDIMTPVTQRAKPVLIAHRGDPAHAPENTWASFRRAIQKGARAVEMDVRRSRDGKWVVFHDRGLKRTTGSAGFLGEASWGKLKALDAGGGERIPLLVDLLRWCRREKIAPFLDLKVSDHPDELLSLLKGSGWLRHVSIGCGNETALRWWRSRLPTQPIFWVTGYHDEVTSRRVARGRRLKVTGIAAYRRWVTKGVLRAAHEANLTLYVWTIRTPRQLARFAKLQVDGILSEVWPPPSI